VSKTKLLVVLAMLVALTAASAVGAGWKWRLSPSHGPAQHAAGWTWDDRPGKGHA
jgi:hypothetical protein